DAAARFADEEGTGGDVPGLYAGFEVGVQAAAGDIGEIQGGGAGAADVFGVAEQLADAFELRAGAGALARGEAGADQGAGQAAAVVAGAVERVDDPGVAAGAAIALHGAAFLAEDGVVGVGAAQFLDDLGFGQAVDFAGVVVAVLFDDVEGVEPVHVPHQDV